MTMDKANLCYYKTGRKRKKGGKGRKITFNHEFSSIPQKKLPPKHAVSVFVTFVWPVQAEKPEILLFKVSLTFKKHFPGCYYLSRDHWKKFGIGSSLQCPEINELISACKVFLETRLSALLDEEQSTWHPAELNPAEVRRVSKHF